ncbi:MAG TPA: putative sulfate exporter family transporter [Caulobacteraceae bacterium]
MAILAIPVTSTGLAQRAVRIVPGLLLCLAITGVAFALQGLEARLFGRAWLEALVLAILLGAAVRTVWNPGPLCAEGIHFSGKTVLEIAVVLLGATVDARAISAAGGVLLIGIVALVVLAIAGSYGLGRLFRLPHRMAALIACGNAICGNSAIAAVAPVIGAEGEDVAAAISFTAILGIAVVLGLPFADSVLHLSNRGYGIVAGLTVYAVPQVLAATAPVSALAVQVGTLVKLVRVLMLGPVVTILALIARSTQHSGPGAARASLPPLAHMIPWFIVGFLLLVAARSLGLTPKPLAAPASSAADFLTIVSMAALGLGVDVRALAGAGPRASVVVTLSLAMISALALLLVRSFRVA